MSDLFRKSALEKLSSPEQLDRTIVITPPAFWIALAGGAMIILGALLWGVMGRIPINVPASGIYVSGDGLNSVYSEINGIVTDIKVATGEQIDKGDVIANVGDGDIDYEIKRLSERQEAVSKVTLNTNNDVITSDDKVLSDIKATLIGLNNVYEQNKQMLALKEQELTDKRQAVAELKAKEGAVKGSYYDSLKTQINVAEEMEYGEAQTDLSMCEQASEAAKANLEGAKSMVEQLDAIYKEASANYKAANSALKALPVDAAPEDVAAVMQQEQMAKEAAAGAKKDLAKANADKKIATTNSTNCKEALATAKERFAKAKSNYESAQVARNNEQIQQGIASNEYSVAATEYNTEKAKVEGLEEAVASLKLQTEQAGKEVETEKEKIEASFNATKKAILSGLQNELEKYGQNLKKYEVVSTQAGIIQEMPITVGTMVGVGNELLKVKQGDSDKKEVICYMPVGDGKKIIPGMEVMIYPTTVNKQEYGHMKGTVEEVSTYVMSQQEMLKKLGNDTLVNAFLENGPVIEVVCSISEDVNTESGYYWSSKKGKDIVITEGTMLEASIITEKKAPITMLIPYIKEMLTEKSGANK